MASLLALNSPSMCWCTIQHKYQLLMVSMVALLNIYEWSIGITLLSKRDYAFVFPTTLNLTFGMIAQ